MAEEAIAPATMLLAALNCAPNFPSIWLVIQWRDIGRQTQRLENCLKLRLRLLVYSSSPSSSLLHFYVASMYDDIRLHALSHILSLSTVPSPWDMLFHCRTTSSPAFLCHSSLAFIFLLASFLHDPHLFSAHDHTISTFFLGLSSRFAPLILSFFTLSYYVTFFNVNCSFLTSRTETYLKHWGSVSGYPLSCQ